jgi:hypothetical protein
VSLPKVGTAKTEWDLVVRIAKISKMQPGNLSLTIQYLRLKSAHFVLSVKTQIGLAKLKILEMVCVPNVRIVIKLTLISIESSHWTLR